MKIFENIDCMEEIEQMVKRIFVNDGKITVVKKTRTHKVSDSMVELKKKKKFLDEVYNKKTK